MPNQRTLAGQFASPRHREGPVFVARLSHQALGRTALRLCAGPGGPIMTSSKGVNLAFGLRLRGGQRLCALVPQRNAALAIFERLDRAKMPVKGASVASPSVRP